MHKKLQLNPQKKSPAVRKLTIVVDALVLAIGKSMSYKYIFWRFPVGKSALPKEKTSPFHFVDISTLRPLKKNNPGKTLIKNKTMNNSFSTIRKKSFKASARKKNLLLNSMIKGILITGLIFSLLPGCKREPVIEVIQARQYILESENLVIPASIAIPENLPAGNKRVATYYAVGVQKYKAQSKAGTTQYEWVFVAPQADLYNLANKKVGTHTAGPSWQLPGLHDSIMAQAYTPAKTSASPDPESIDWLLLKPKAGTKPIGIFENVSYIQRIATSGGKAPLKAPKNANETVNVNYTAIYRFTQQNQ